PIIPGMPIMPVINFAKGASRTGKNFGKVCAAKSDISELSEGNGGIRKKVKRNFGEKRLLGGCT
ncbi:MAG: hypothetical protein ACFNVN_09480, partial [Capnocytophaga ochracea]